MRASGVLRRRASRLMSIPAAFSRWNRSAPSGLSIGIITSETVRSSRARSARASFASTASGAAKYASRSASAIVAVDSSPCICDQSSTTVGPRPQRNARTERPCIDRPISSSWIAPLRSDGAIARHSSACVKVRFEIAATRNCRAMSSPIVRQHAGGRSRTAAVELASAGVPAVVPSLDGAAPPRIPVTTPHPASEIASMAARIVRNICLVMPTTSAARARSVLTERFGHREFKKGQWPAIEAILEGRDALVVMPTGSGKSLIYQLPALMVDGLTVVVSPLIALMKDQQDKLHAHGVDALAMHSHLSAAGAREVHSQVESGGG